MQQAQQTPLVGAVALDGFGFGRLEDVLEHRAEKHRRDQQDGGEQGTPQGFLIVFADTDQAHRRHQHHQQDRPIPEPGENPQRLLQGRLLQALGQWTVADQVRHGPAHANHQPAEDHRSEQAGEHRDAAGDVAAQLPGDLRAGQGIAEGSEKADHEQRPGAETPDHRHRSAFVAGIEHHDYAQQHRSGENTAAGGVGKAQRQGSADRNLQEVADVQGQRQADHRRSGVWQQITEQVAQALAGAQPAAPPQMSQQQPRPRPDQRKSADPDARQQQEIPRHAPGRTGRLVHQPIHLIRRPIRPQTPGVHQALVEVELVLDVIDARTDRPQQTALYQRRRLGGRFVGLGGAGDSGGPVGAGAAHRQQEQQQYSAQSRQNAGLQIGRAHV